MPRGASNSVPTSVNGGGVKLIRGEFIWHRSVFSFALEPNIRLRKTIETEFQ